MKLGVAEHERPTKSSRRMIRFIQLLSAEGDIDEQLRAPMGVPGAKMMVLPK